MNYWVKRNQKAQEKLVNKSIDEIQKQLIKYYQKSMLGVIDSFAKTYDKLLSSVENGKQPTPADLYKLDTYWKTQNQLKSILQSLGDKQVEALSKNFVRTFINVYNSLAIKSDIEFSRINVEIANQLINNIWCADGKIWSQRIWDNTNRLQQKLNDSLLHCVITGKKTTELKKLLQTEFNVSYNRADTLVRTELAHIQTEASKKRYQDYGIQQVEVYADKDERRCEVCGKLHQKRFSINETMPIPAHPNCRCVIIPVVDD